VSRIGERNTSARSITWAIIPGLLLVGQAALGQFPAPPSWTVVPQTQYFDYGPGNGQANLNGTQPPYNYNFVGSNPPQVDDQLGCTWNTSDLTPPPYWYQFVGWNPLLQEYTWSPLSGPVMRGGNGAPAAVGSWYQPSQTFRGIKVIASFVPGDFLSSPFGESAAIYYSQNKCFGGDQEYGFSYSPDVGPPVGGMSGNYEVVSFYFSQYTNCPTGQLITGADWCALGTLEQSPATGVGHNSVAGCGAQVGFLLPPNPSHGNYWYNFTAWAYNAGTSGSPHYQIAAQVTDAYTGAMAWQIIADPANKTTTWSSVSPAGSLTYQDNYNCPSSYTPFNTGQLLSASGGIVVGISSNGDTDPWNTSSGTVAMTSTFVYTGN